MLKAVNFILLSLFSLTVLLPMWFMFITAVKTSQEVFAYPRHGGLRNLYGAISVKPGRRRRLAATSAIRSSSPPLRWSDPSCPTRSLHMGLQNEVCRTKFLVCGHPGHDDDPGFVTMIPQYILYANIGWVGTFLPLIVPPFLGSAFFIFMLRQFYMTIPTELIESAYIDGANNFYIWRKLIVPMSAPALTTVGVLAFNGGWNDFLGPLLYLTDPATFTRPSV